VSVLSDPAVIRVSLSYLNRKRFQVIYIYLLIFVCFNSNIWQHCIDDSAGLEHVMQMLGA